MNSAKTKFLIGGALVLGTAGYLMATSIKETGIVLPDADRARHEDRRGSRRSGTPA